MHESTRKIRADSHRKWRDLPLILLGALGCCSALPASGQGIFDEAARASGLDFVHFNGMSGELYFPEMMGSGVALFDYDNDGDLDVYLVQGRMLGPGKTTRDALIQPAHPQPLTDRLYRNDGSASRQRDAIQFTDVTEKAHIQAYGYGMGVTAGDINNDGYTDLYVTNYGPNQLLLNNGDGTFSDITQAANAQDNRWSVSASFFDIDRDGWLDLYVGNYVNFTFANHKPCRSTTSARDYCSPLGFDPQPDRLLRNNRDGTFSEVSVASGITDAYGGALGVVAADFNGDSWQDVYVANDSVPNQLWINQKDGTFRDQAILAGVSVNMHGSPEASMGVDAADFDGDGDEDLFMTHLFRETNTLFVNDGSGWFEDKTLGLGLANASFAYTGFGTAWFDYDNDGLLDLLCVNGAVTRIQKQIANGDVHPLHQVNQLFANRGEGRFEEVTADAGLVFTLSEVSRGAAFGDIDNDGDTDVIISNNAQPARLLLNQTGNKSSWLGLRLVDQGGGRDMYGARAVIDRASRTPLWRRVSADGSYAAANDSRLLFGLGEDTERQNVTVYWPDGTVEQWTGLEARRYHVLRQGSGNKVEVTSNE